MLLFTLVVPFSFANWSNLLFQSVSQGPYAPADVTLASMQVPLPDGSMGPAAQVRRPLVCSLEAS